jgi:hypothetical protein
MSVLIVTGVTGDHSSCFSLVDSAMSPSSWLSLSTLLVLPTTIGLTV